MPIRVVHKDEFDVFLAAYPNRLETDETGICEPPLRTYNDFTQGAIWPKSIVASVVLYESYPKDGQPPYSWGPNEYRIHDHS